MAFVVNFGGVFGFPKSVTRLVSLRNDKEILFSMATNPLARFLAEEVQQSRNISHSDDTEGAKGAHLADSMWAQS